jgi:stage III sporulation protein AA
MRETPLGVLVYSPPGHGKTTYLKSLIYLLSMGIYTNPYRVSVVDERFELGEGLCKKGLCDIISGATKEASIELLTRTMSPEIIVCDEIHKGEKDAIINGCNSGTSFICSVHGKSVEEIKKRAFVLPLIEADIFEYAVGIKKNKGKYEYVINKL